MNKRLYVLTVVLLVALAMGVTPIFGQTSARTATRQPAPAASAVTQSPAALLAMLPASDAVVTADVRRILNDAAPRVIGDDAARIAQFNAALERFKTKTGVDPRAVEQLAIGVHYVNPSASVTRMEPVAIARGAFNVNAITAAGRAVANSRYREENYGGRRIYVFNLNEQMSLLGFLNVRINEVAFSPLDANTLVMGQLANVQRAIDAFAQRAPRVNAELVALATRSPNALVGFGGNVPGNALNGVDLGDADITRNIRSIRQLYGAVGTTSAGFDMQAFLRTGTPDEARRVSEMITALKVVGSGLITQALGTRGGAAGRAVESMRINAQGNEVQLTLELSQADLTTLTR